jgi:regulator of protease activity HflC (stomatin/prohibitin superfamily)
LISSLFAQMGSSLTAALVWATLASLFVLYVARRALGKRGRRLPFKVMVALPLLAISAVIVAFSLMVVQVGTVKVVSVFGKVREVSYTSGLHLVVPGSRAAEMSIRRQVFELSGGSLDDAPPAPAAAATAAAPAADVLRTLALTSDRIPLAVDINFPFILNPDLAWKVFANVGPNYQAELLAPVARAAVRAATAGFSWTGAVTTERVELEKRILELFQQTVSENLVGAGFTAKEAQSALALAPPQVRRMSPPRRLLTAVGETLAAQEELKRQGILVEVGLQEAQRRANEGLGIQKLLNQLPKEFTPADLKSLISAAADKQRADAMLKAVERDQVKVMIMGGGEGSAPAVSVPAQ